MTAVLAGKGWREHMEGMRWRENIEGKGLRENIFFQCVRWAMVAQYSSAKIKKNHFGLT